MGFRKFNGHLTEIEYPVPGVDTAINILRPGGRWELYNKEIVAWEHDEGLEPPTWDEIQEEVKRLRVEMPKAEPVGRYAVRFVWTSGCSSGLWSFTHLTAIATGMLDN